MIQFEKENGELANNTIFKDNQARLAKMEKGFVDDHKAVVKCQTMILENQGKSEKQFNEFKFN